MCRLQGQALRMIGSLVGWLVGPLFGCLIGGWFSDVFWIILYCTRFGFLGLFAWLVSFGAYLHDVFGPNSFLIRHGYSTAVFRVVDPN